VENRVAPSNGDRTPEEIERDMQQTRESITEKVAALENQVVGTVQTAADTITNTVEAVKSLVSHAPEAVSDTVKQAATAVSETFSEAFDVNGQVQKRPWAAVGVSAALGFVAGWFMTRDRHPPLGMAEPISGPSYAPGATHAATSPEPRPEPPREPGVVDQLMGMIGSHVRELATTAMNTVSASLKDNIQHEVPKLINDAASNLTEPGPRTEAPPAYPGARYGQ
jgi:ElaB/YqjD/DUF883 family membrane-anchored ribosome-binding protein